MKGRRSSYLLACLATCGALMGQIPDSTRTPEHGKSSSGLLLWSSPLQEVVPDTLQMNLPSSPSQRDGWLKAQRWIAMGVAVGCGAASYYYQQEAERTYEAYEKSGNKDELEALYRKATELDRLSGWYYLGAEAGLILMAVSFSFSL